VEHLHRLICRLLIVSMAKRLEQPSIGDEGEIDPRERCDDEKKL